MLEKLYVNNFALIDELEVDFGPGLNVLSGETGAGKSIIIGSLNFVLGGKADKDIIKTGCDITEVSALVSVDNDELKAELENCDVAVDDDNYVLIKRTFNRNGKSSCKINGKTATVSMVKEISAFLVDIHGQHDHQSLLNPKSHIIMLDRLCGSKLDKELEKLGILYNEYRDVSKKLKGIDINDKNIQDKIELYTYQINEIESANLKAGEDEILAERRNILLNSVRLQGYVNDCLDFLYRNENSAIESIGNAADNLSSISEIDESQGKILESLNDAYAIVEDVVKSVRLYEDSMDRDPNELNEVEERLQTIYKLKNKYGNTIEKVLAYFDNVSEKLNIIENSEALALEYSEKKKILEQKIRKICSNISDIRKSAGEDAEKKIIRILKDLSMENACFKINITEKEGFDGNGFDNVEFLISANRGEKLKPLSKIASGGEMSRVMLALKNVLADVDNIDTFVFDEIDTGISGRTAQKVAEKMLAVAKGHQILCITHLPQIAAMADNNYLIEKSSEGERTYTNIVELSDEKVYNELARLIGGAEITRATLEAAKEMKLMANKLKEN
ncbi:MAG: DNA repair protein RecN [Clostridia bacterium]|nr:DNA repair protein RecN [Clostridia bacterium]